jgi:hypothetical protein
MNWTSLPSPPLSLLNDLSDRISISFCTGMWFCSPRYGDQTGLALRRGLVATVLAEATHLTPHTDDSLHFTSKILPMATA